MIAPLRVLSLLLFSFIVQDAYPQRQDSSLNQLDIFSSIDAGFNKSIKKVQRKLDRMRRKCQEKCDSLNSAALATQLTAYQRVHQALDEVESGKVAHYVGRLDSLQTLYNLSKSGSFALSPSQREGLMSILKNLDSKNTELITSVAVQDWIKQQRDVLQAALLSNGMIKEVRQLKALVAEWHNRAKTIRNELENPGRAAEKLLGKAREIPVFRDFFRKHSQLASLFQLPGDPQVEPLTTGLQTRTSVFGLLQQRTAMAGPQGPDILNQSISSAQSELKNIQEKINKIGGLSDEDMEAADFKPTSTKTKTFLQRLRYGSDFQSLPSTSLLPATSDFGLSVGYMISDKGEAGIGLSYKLGWGESWRKIRLSNQGLGLRSFIDVKAWRSLFLTGGFEYNYQPISSAIIPDTDISNWSKSALLGITSVVPIRSKISKRAKAQLLWDAMAVQQGRQAVKFRIGYSF